MRSLVKDKPLIKSMVGERIWALKSIDLVVFDQELEAYFERGYPGFRVVSYEYPYIFLSDEREANKAN